MQGKHMSVQRKIAFIRTYVPSGMGGPLPPVDLLSMAAFIKKRSNEFDIRIIDTGQLPAPAIDSVLSVLSAFEPDVICCSSLPWEAGLVHAIAAASKHTRSPLFIVHGQMVSVLREDLLRDPHIDCGILGDGEETLWALLAAGRGDADLTRVDGIVCRASWLP
jgi:hypothetical protein